MPRRREDRETITDVTRKAIAEEMLRLHYLGDYSLDWCWWLTHPEKYDVPSASARVMAQRTLTWYHNSHHTDSVRYMRHLFAERTRKNLENLRDRAKGSEGDAEQHPASASG